MEAGEVRAGVGLGEALRPIDVVARHFGEEFVLDGLFGVVHHGAGDVGAGGALRGAGVSQLIRIDDLPRQGAPCPPNSSGHCHRPIALFDELVLESLGIGTVVRVVKVVAEDV